MTQHSREPLSDFFRGEVDSGRAPRVPIPGAIVIFRLAALVLAVVVAAALWQVMASLPWEADTLLAAAAVAGWAYRFEQGDGPS